MSQVTVGRTVHYTLNEADASAISSRRSGTQEGNRVAAGEVYPAVVVRVFDPSVNLHVLLDGSDSYWATSRTEGNEPGFWSWPPRV